MKITNCKTNHLVNPIGFNMESIRLSYNVEEAIGRKQKAARIVVATDDELKDIVYDSGYDEKIKQLGTDIDIRLQPRTRYFWTVSLISEKDEETTSDINYFETGKMDEKWLAKWICCPKKETHPVFCKNVRENLPGLSDGKEIFSARLYISGLGLYEAYLNDEKIGNELLTPYCNNYKKWVQYQTYDITEALNKGTDFKVLMGDGWHLGRFGFYSSLVKEEKSPVYELIAEIRVRYTDGTEEAAYTNEEWEVKGSNIIFSNIYDGEQVDDTIPDDGKREKATVSERMAYPVERYSLPVKIHESFSGKLIKSSLDETVLDFGQNMSGIFRLKVHEERGTKIHLQFGETLQDGHFYRDNLRSAKAEYIYISDGKDHVVSPHFTFYGFRYVKVTGISDFKEDDLEAYAIYSDLTDTGDMATGNPKVNRLIENVRWGQRSNFVDVPTDCPQRDERMGWTGDAQVFSNTAMFLTDSYAFYRKYLHDMKTEQEEKGGMVPDVVPSFGVNTCSSVWGDATVIIPYNMYLNYGDENILREHYPAMKAWIEYIMRIDGDEHKWREEFSYADWVALDNRNSKKDIVLGGTDEAYVSDIYYYNSSRILSEVAGILGFTADAEKYLRLSESVLEYLKKDYFSETGRCCCDTQTAQVLALEYGIAPVPEMSKKMLKKALIKADGKLQTGFTGTPFLCKVLSENGMADMAYDLLLNEDYPGWLYEVNHGATTIWERWNSIEEDGSMSSTGMNSLNHYAYGAVLDWMFKYVGGVRPLTPGYESVKIAPVIDLRLGSCSVTYRSISGLYCVNWKILKGSEGRSVMISFDVPFGCEAVIDLPGITDEGKDKLLSLNGISVDGNNGCITAAAGHYGITYTAKTPFVRIYSTQDTLAELQNNKTASKVIDKFISDFKMMDLAYRNRTLREIVLKRSGDLYRDRHIDTAGIYTEEQLKMIDDALYEAAVR